VDGNDTDRSWVEEIVEQIEDELGDTAPMETQHGRRASTSSDWPPEPPLPADVELAQGTLSDNDPIDDLELAAGTITHGQPVRRHAEIFAAVRRPTTSGD